MFGIYEVSNRLGGCPDLFSGDIEYEDAAEIDDDTESNVGDEDEDK